MKSTKCVRRMLTAVPIHVCQKQRCFRLRTKTDARLYGGVVLKANSSRMVIHFIAADYHGDLQLRKYL